MKTVLVTGTSTGIGHAVALDLAARGYHVLAGVRRAEDGEALRAAARGALEPISLDVADPAAVEAAGRRVDALPGLFALVNNAGFNLNGAFEHTDEAEARRLMEVNFFGLANLSRRLIPALRRGAGEGTSKLINVSSIGGSIGLPWEVYYHASKFAVVGLTEGLRAELWRQRIRAVVVQPGDIRTEFMPKTDAGIAAALARMPEEGRARYGAAMQVLRSRIAAAARYGSPPSHVARTVARILAARDPGFRHFVGLDAHLLHAGHALLPRRWSHAFFRAAFGA
jgi:NAD(P)-dependent dehydrogenase (short-subunit alcohol dehydrogenase family)